MQFDFHSTKSIIVKRGGSSDLAKIIQDRNGSSVFIVTDPGVLSAGLLDYSLLSFKSQGLH